ncbi:hypothetical protein DID78_02730 [Candidatus Marinamargulisbacteria bacterium SCGC AG-343-D04]|nr:hypothetical protein DID78_02730 [Candidatus Marinamargulisbacteria bacterium SCGC AG-343-D04]
MEIKYIKIILCVICIGTLVACGSSSDLEEASTTTTIAETTAEELLASQKIALSSLSNAPSPEIVVSVPSIEDIVTTTLSGRIGSRVNHNISKKIIPNTKLSLQIQTLPTNIADLEPNDLPGNECGSSFDNNYSFTFSEEIYQWSRAPYFDGTYDCLYKNSDTGFGNLRSYFDDSNNAAGNYKAVASIDNFNINQNFQIPASDGTTLNANINWFYTFFMQEIHLTTSKISLTQATLNIKTTDLNGVPNGRGYWISDIEILSDDYQYTGYDDGVAWMDLTLENFDMDLDINFNALSSDQGNYALTISSDIEFGVPWYNYDRGNAQKILQELVVTGSITKTIEGSVASLFTSDSIQIEIGCVQIFKQGDLLGCSICLESGQNITITCD